MNHLNSIILEGTVEGTPADDGNEIVIFFVDSKQNDKSIMVEIVASGKLGASCLEILRHGLGVRVVGYLATYEDALVIRADHVEFKPIYKRPE